MALKDNENAMMDGPAPVFGALPVTGVNIMGFLEGSGCRTSGHVIGVNCLLGSLVFATFALQGPLEAQEAETTTSAPRAGSVFFSSEDGVRLHGLYAPGKPNGVGAVLIHMAGRSSQDWMRLGERFASRGTHTLAVDLRGHGESTTRADQSTLSVGQLTAEDYAAMTSDIAAAVTFLRTKTSASPNDIVLIGASLGANLALQYAATDPRISNVLLLSPGLEYKGVTSEGAMQSYGNRPVFIAVRKEDVFSAKSSLVLSTMAKGKSYMQICTGAGHGTKMLQRDPSLEPKLVQWMNGTLAEDDASSVPVPSVRGKDLE